MVRPSKNIWYASHNLNANVNAVVNEMKVLVKALARINRDAQSQLRPLPKVSLLWMPLHGHGHHAPSKDFRNMPTETLRDYGSIILGQLRQILEVEPGSPDLQIFDIFNIAQGAECHTIPRNDANCACGGLYESEDGSHSTLTVLNMVGHVLVRAMKKYSEM